MERLFTIFQTLSPFPDFFQVWKIAGQITRLFQEFTTLYEPCIRLIAPKMKYS